LSSLAQLSRTSLWCAEFVPTRDELTRLGKKQLLAAAAVIKGVQG
jgi:hypothetical protein